MSLQFHFSFRETSITVNPGELAGKFEYVKRLRTKFNEAAEGATSEARQAKGDQALAGLIARCVRLYGEDYLGSVSEALERIFKARNDIADQLDKTLRGEAPDFAQMTKDFDEIDLAFPEVLRPEDSVPPKAPLSDILPAPAAPRSIASLADLLARIPAAMKRLTAAKRNSLEAANIVDPDALRSLLNAENRETFDPSRKTGPLLKLTTALKQAGWSESSVNDLVSTAEDLNEAWRKSDAFTPPEIKAASDAAIAGLADSAHALPHVAELQKAVAGSNVLRALLRQNPEQLRTLWRNFDAKIRPYGFGLYVWFNMLHVKGQLGEFSAAFDLGRSGILIFLKGPKADVTTPGTDLVCFDRNTGELFLIDNKAVKAPLLSEVSALMRNISKNLSSDLQELQSQLGHESNPGLESILQRMQRADRKIKAVIDLLPADPELRKLILDANFSVSLPSGEVRPVQEVITEILNENNIRRVVTNAGGQLTRLSEGLSEAGITLEDLNAKGTE